MSIKPVTAHRPKLDYGRRLIQALAMPVPPGVAKLDHVLRRFLPGVVPGEEYSSYVYCEPANQMLWWVSSTSLFRDGQVVPLAMLGPSDARRMQEVAADQLRDHRGNIVGCGEPKAVAGNLAIELWRRLRDDEMAQLDPDWHNGPIAAMMRSQTPESVYAGPTRAATKGDE